MYTVSRKRKAEVQVGCPFAKRKDVGIQCSESRGSYGRNEESTILTYDQLREKYLWSKDHTLYWLKEEGLIASRRVCDVCQSSMNCVECDDRSDGFVWQCRKQIGKKRHRVEKSIREGSWFEKSNFSIEEVIKFTYWWCQGLDQWQIKQQLGLGSHTAVDWDMFCRELCEVTIFEKRERLGEPGKVVQIDESKIGNRKYHRGHVVEGQWVFGGIEQDSRKCFIVTVEDRTEATLVSHIQEWVEQGTTIVSDCWKGYVNLEKYGYEHKTVNHSVEFVSPEGYDTNKIEGHWRQMKVSLPTHGRKKEHYASYLAEFLWRYINSGKDLFFVFLKDVASVYQFKD